MAPLYLSFSHLSLFPHQVRDQKQREWAEQKAARQAEYELQRKAFEEEEAKRDPWEKEKEV